MWRMPPLFRRVFVAWPFMDLRYNPRFEICIETDLLRRFVDLTLCASEHVLLCVSLQLGGVRRVGEAPHKVWHEADREYRAQLRIKLFPLRLRKLPRKVRVLPSLRHPYDEKYCPRGRQFISKRQR